MGTLYCPERGDVVWLRFSPQSGHEQAGERPALTLSPVSYNRKSGLAIFCPITKQIKGYPFEVPFPTETKIQGAVLADQARSLDWQSRTSRFYCKAPKPVLREVTRKLGTLLHMFVEE